jgi:hypothetical protein
MGTDPSTGQPITTNEWVDRLAPKAAAVVALGTCATYGGIPAMKNNPTGAMGVADYLGWDWKSSAGLPVVNIPGCPVQPDNTTESLLYLALHLAGRAPVPDLDEAHRPTWLFGRTVGKGATERASPSRASSPPVRIRPSLLGETGLQGPVVKCNVPVRGWQSGVGAARTSAGSAWPARCRGSRQVHAVHGRGSVWRCGCGDYELHLWADRAIRTPAQRSQEVRRRARLAQAGRDSVQWLQVPVRRLRAPARRAINFDKRRREEMATTETPSTSKKVAVKEMSGSDHAHRRQPRIHTEIDFDAKKVEKAYSTSMIFRGFDIFMKGIDPRDAHFITSRICGICGDNHCTTSCINQNMAYGVKPPALGDLGYNLAETADYMFDHAIFNDCMANVDFCEQMVKETIRHCCRRPSRRRSQLRRPRLQDDRGHHAVPEPVHRGLLSGDAPGGALHAGDVLPVRRRHTHPSTIMPGGSRWTSRHQTCTDYYVRLMRYIDYVKRAVPMHDDLYDFFLQELPGYDMVGYRDTDLVCWGYFDDPDYVDYDYKNMADWGRKRHITPGVVLKGELITTDLWSRST